jgi:hypothetical protein
MPLGPALHGMRDIGEERINRDLLTMLRADYVQRCLVYQGLHMARNITRY